MKFFKFSRRTEDFKSKTENIMRKIQGSHFQKKTRLIESLVPRGADLQARAEAHASATSTHFRHSQGHGSGQRRQLARKSLRLHNAARRPRGDLDEDFVAPRLAGTVHRKSGERVYGRSLRAPSVRFNASLQVASFFKTGASNEIHHERNETLNLATPPVVSLVDEFKRQDDELLSFADLSISSDSDSSTSSSSSSLVSPSTDLLQKNNENLRELANERLKDVDADAMTVLSENGKSKMEVYKDLVEEDDDEIGVEEIEHVRGAVISHIVSVLNESAESASNLPYDSKRTQLGDYEGKKFIHGSEGRHERNSELKSQTLSNQSTLHGGRTSSAISIARVEYPRHPQHNYSEQQQGSRLGNRPPVTPQPNQANSSITNNEVELISTSSEDDDDPDVWSSDSDAADKIGATSRPLLSQNIAAPAQTSKVSSRSNVQLEAKNSPDMALFGKSVPTEVKEDSIDPTRKNTSIVLTLSPSFNKESPIRFKVSALDSLKQMHDLNGEGDEFYAEVTSAAILVQDQESRVSRGAGEDIPAAHTSLNADENHSVHGTAKNENENGEELDDCATLPEDNDEKEREDVEIYTSDTQETTHLSKAHSIHMNYDIVQPTHRASPECLFLRHTSTNKKRKILTRDVAEDSLHFLSPHSWTTVVSNVRLLLSTQDLAHKKRDSNRITHKRKKTGFAPCSLQRLSAKSTLRV